MRTLIGTPCGGGMVNQKYMTSLLTQAFLHSDRLKMQQRYALGLYTLANESLISRGRNHIAQVALAQEWDRLFFIDADVSWNWAQMKSVIDACSAKDGRGVIAGACPLKALPLRLNFMPFPEEQKFFGDMQTPAGLLDMADERGGNLHPVPYIGTAFMCIDTQVLKDLTGTAAPYSYPDPDTGESLPHWDFFPVGPIKNHFVSEDWGFCHLAREAGHGVFVNSDVMVGHTGPYTYLVDVETELKNLSETRLARGV